MAWFKCHNSFGDEVHVNLDRVGRVTIRSQAYQDGTSAVTFSDDQGLGGFVAALTTEDLATLRAMLPDQYSRLPRDRP